MGRFRRGGVLPNKQDTPVKATWSRQHKKRKLLSNKQFEVFPEESEVEDVNVMTIKPANQVCASIKPAHYNSLLHFSKPVLAENLRYKAVLPTTTPHNKHGHQVSQGHPGFQVTPDSEALKGGEMQIREEQNLAATTVSIITSSTESDATFSSEDEDNCYSSASTTCTSLPSPEIFREETYADDLLGLHRHVGNSTLLNVSHAKSIHMHHPPNVSTIIDASTISADKNCEISNQGIVTVEAKAHTDSFPSDKAFRMKTPPYNTKRRILCKKKVVFKSPLIAKQINPKGETSRVGEIGSKEDTLHLKVILKRPKRSSLEHGVFFDFASDGDRDEFFQMARERCSRLRSFALFPLPVANHIKPSVP